MRKQGGVKMKLLVALDLSPASQKILDEVTPLASALSAKLWLLHVAEPSSGMVAYKGSLRNNPSDDRLDPEYARDQIAKKFHDEHKSLQKEAEKLRAVGVETTALVVQGSTIEVLLHEAKKLDIEMIVVGSHGHGAVYDLLIGSVSESILRQATCPVLVIPTHGGLRNDADNQCF